MRAAQVDSEHMESTGEKEGIDVRTMHSTLRNIGYAAAMVGGASATVYALAQAARNRDMSGVWAYDEAAAPPRALQPELLGLTDYAESGDDRRPQGRGCALRRSGGVAANEHYLGARDDLDAEVQRAVDAGNMGRVEALARQRQALDASHSATHDGGRVHRLPPQRAGPGRLEDEEHSTRRLAAQRGGPGGLKADEYGANDDDDARRPPGGRKSSRDRYTRPADQCAPSPGGQMPEYSDDEPPPACSGHRVLRRRCDEAHTDWYDDPRVRGDHSEGLTRTGEQYTMLRAQATSRDDRTPVYAEGGRGARYTDAIDGRSLLPSRACRGPPQHNGAVGPCIPQTTPPVSESKARGPAACVAAEAEFRVNDLVKAQCPCTGEMCDATISTLSGNGLVKVRWHNPGFAPDGRPFHQFGDVWADKMRLVFRKDLASPGEKGGSQGAAAATATNWAEDTPDGLQTGDPCFAVGYMLEKKWFQARVLSIRAKEPRLRVEYTATLEGETSKLALPEPRKAYVFEDHVSRENPPPTVPRLACAEAPGASAHSSPKVALPEAPGAATDPASELVETQAPAEAAARPADGGTTKSVEEAIDDDLMCVVCSRPDDEALMLVCDCKMGYHIYCLSPPLATVPEGQWQCPACVKKAAASADA